MLQNDHIRTLYARLDRLRYQMGRLFNKDCYNVTATPENSSKNSSV